MNKTQYTKPDGKTPILCIAGPTASGKSARAVAEALRRNGEIISVDSRQVYRSLDIGTEKISPMEQKGVPHHLIDILDPREPYSAGTFVQDATALIAEITARGKTPILAGGTHFYFDALLSGLPDEVPIHTELRLLLEKKTNEELYEDVLKQDARRAAALDPHNRRRLIRALEIISAKGTVTPRPTKMTDLRNPSNPSVSSTDLQSPYKVEWIVIDPSMEKLRDRIENRLKNALARGLVEEVWRVREAVGDARLHELGLEYRIVGEFLAGKRTEETLLPTLASALCKYARRQKAWLRKLRIEHCIDFTE